MNYYGYQRQPQRFDFIRNAVGTVANTVRNLPATEEAAQRRKLFNEKLERIEIGALEAEEIRQKRIIEMAKEYEDRIGEQPSEREWTKIEAQFMPPLSEEERNDPKGAMRKRSDLDTLFEGWLDKKAVEKFRSKSGQRITPEGPAGPGYQPPEQPQVDVAQKTPTTIPGTTTPVGSYTGGPTSIAGMRRDVENEMLRQPRTTVPETSEDMYQRGAAAGITERPEFKADYQRQENLETGEAFGPAGTRAEYLASEYAGGRGGEASQKIAGALPTEKDIMTQKRLEDAARMREKNNAERNRIAAWRAAIANNKMTSDERLKIMKAKSDNEVDALDLELKIKKLETDLKTKANKTDPVTFQPMMSQEEMSNSLEELKQLRTDLVVLEDFRSEYDGLIKEKGGIRPSPRPVQPTQPVQPQGPSKAGFNQWLQNRGR